MRIPAQLGTGALAQRRVVRLLEGAVDAPLAEVVVDGLPGRILAGQEPPRAAALQDVRDRASRRARRLWILGRPPGFSGGRRESKQLHSASERSVGYVLMHPSVRCLRLAQTTFQTVSNTE